MAFRAYEVVRVACESHSCFVLYAPGETGLKQTNYATGVSHANYESSKSHTREREIVLFTICLWSWQRINDIYISTKVANYAPDS